MCGRFSLTATPEAVQELFGPETLEDFPPRYNIAPTQAILAIIADRPRAPGDNRTDRRAFLARWGFLPGWVKDPAEFPLIINARSETAIEKASFRAAIRHRRILIPASGFYEWQRPPKSVKEKSKAFWIRPKGGGIVAFGGLMETYMTPDGAEMDTVCVLTSPANADIAAIHDRMPVTIAPQDFSRWLDCRGQEPRDVADLMAPAPQGLFEAGRVSDAVNTVANTGLELQTPFSPAEEPQAPADKAARRRAGSPADSGQMDLF